MSLFVRTVGCPSFQHAIENIFISRLYAELRSRGQHAGPAERVRNCAKTLGLSVDATLMFDGRKGII